MAGGITHDMIWPEFGQAKEIDEVLDLTLSF